MGLALNLYMSASILEHFLVYNRHDFNGDFLSEELEAKMIILRDKINVKTSKTKKSVPKPSDDKKDDTNKVPTSLKGDTAKKTKKTTVKTEKALINPELKEDQKDDTNNVPTSPKGDMAKKLKKTTAKKAKEIVNPEPIEDKKDETPNVPTSPKGGTTEKEKSDAKVQKKIVKK